ncbi:MAG: 3D-(3,5/4)-trihydroxycyclohexane-1,2-dione acylhydrolase (decyclizing), partial [Anaerolineae bacterium]|nr:3D-(3,5/4)-trihydroxycyclohexane-1,2-dione acylhydrolase (decyclizing) [Anaerolineae bacterium]
VQTMAYDYPAELFERRVWHIPRSRPDVFALRRAAEWIRQSRQPIIVAGGGVLYSEATAMLRRFVEQTGIPVGETQAGKGALPYDHPSALGAIGSTGTEGANVLAREADLVIGIGTRYSDFTTASKSAFQRDNVRFININVAEFDAYKHSAIPLVGDARATLEELLPLLDGWQVSPAYRARAADYNRAWDAEVQRIYSLEHGPLISQGEVIGVVNTLSRPQDVVLCAAGSLPGDLHKLWRTRDPKGYHLEYGYSCMGYEIPGGIGAKLAAPEREVYVMIGDGTYLMMPSEIVTAVQERLKITIILLDNHGFASIGGLSASVGSEGFGTRYRFRTEGDQLEGDVLPIDFAANAASLGATVMRASTRDQLADALTLAREHQGGPVCIVVETDREQRVGGYESWWDVAVAEVSESESVREARVEYEEAKARQRHYL